MQLVDPFLLLLLIIVTLIFFNRIYRQTQQINKHLKDIAESQRILANNPKSFEETKKVNALKNKTPFS